MDIKIISSRDLKPMAITTGKSMTFTDNKEVYYASRRVANEILAAQYGGRHIDVWVQKPDVIAGQEDRMKPWQRMNWLATPSRF